MQLVAIGATLEAQFFTTAQERSPESELPAHCDGRAEVVGLVSVPGGLLSTRGRCRLMKVLAVVSKSALRV